MRGKPVTKNDVEIMIKLRRTGHSLPEIRKITARGNATVFKYIKNVKILDEYKDILRSKQGGSKNRASKEWCIASKKVKEILPEITTHGKLFILAALYWGEGTKRELNIINSDPDLLRVFVECLSEIGVTRDMLRVTIRIYKDTSEVNARKYWAEVLGIPEKGILGVNVLEGKKDGKLKYGMCRIRVAKGAKYFKLIMSMIELLKSKI